MTHPLDAPTATTGGKDMSIPYSVASLAERWGCSKRHISKLVKQGRLQPFRVGNLLRFRPEVVEAGAGGSNPLSPTKFSAIYWR